MKPMLAKPELKSTLSAQATPAARGALASLALAMLLSSLGTSIANVGLPTLAQAFHASFQQVQWVVLAYLLGVTTLIVSVGRLGDVLGRKRLMLAGMALFTLASALCSLAPALEYLIAARALQGLGAAVMMVLTMAMVGEAVPKARTGSAMGLLGTLSATGTALGPSLGGLLIASLGWPALFFINLPLGLLALLLAVRYLPQDRQAPGTARAGFDALGTLLLAMALGCYALAMTLGRGSFGAVNGALLLAAAIALGLFVRAQSRARFPLVQLALFKHPALGTGFAMSALVTTVVMASLVVGPFYLSGALALDAAQVGLVMSCGPLVAALTGAPAGHLVDRHGSAPISRVGLAGMLLGSVLMSLLPGAWGVAAYIAPLVLITGGYALFQAANNTAVMASTAQDQRGVVSGLLNLSRNLGLVTGASLRGAVFAWAGGGSAGLRATFAGAAALVLLALAIARTS